MNSEAQRVLRLTTWLLRLMGLSICLAFFPIFMPLRWMHDLHAWLGLGDAPQAPVFEYLARSTSVMYFAHGCIVLLASTDVRHYLTLVKVLAVLNLFVGLVLLCTDLYSPMPSYWTWLEGPPIMAGGLILLGLAGRIESGRPGPQ